MPCSSLQSVASVGLYDSSPSSSYCVPTVSPWITLCPFERTLSFLSSDRLSTLWGKEKDFNGLKARIGKMCSLWTSEPEGKEHFPLLLRCNGRWVKAGRQWSQWGGSPPRPAWRLLENKQGGQAVFAGQTVSPTPALGPKGVGNSFVLSCLVYSLSRSLRLSRLTLMGIVLQTAGSRSFCFLDVSARQYYFLTQNACILELISQTKIITTS